ncbi:MAG: hypothetical protein WCT31_01425 [Candidatus Micrarchaeia archaeon]
MADKKNAQQSCAWKYLLSWDKYGLWLGPLLCILALFALNLFYSEPSSFSIPPAISYSLAMLFGILSIIVSFGKINKKIFARFPYALFLDGSWILGRKNSPKSFDMNYILWKFWLFSILAVLAELGLILLFNMKTTGGMVAGFGIILFAVHFAASQR